MKKLLALSVVLAVFAMAQTSYGGGSAFVVVYKGTIKAPKTIVDINDNNSLLSVAANCYLALAINTSNGTVSESNSVIYDAKKKYYKITQDACVFVPPVDPCNARILGFGLSDNKGMLELMATGKCKLTKVYTDPNRALMRYVPQTLNGGGFLGSYALFDTTQPYSGAMTISLILDPKLTIQANSPPYYNADAMIDGVIVPKLTAKDPSGWTSWPGYPLGEK
jgi:hypothetical protein